MFDERGNDLSTVADEAMAKVLSVSPAIHASAHVLTAANLRNWLIIVPSSGTELNFRHALARNAGQRTFKARAALCGSSNHLIVKKMKRLASAKSCIDQSFTRHAHAQAKNLHRMAGQKSFAIALPARLVFQSRWPEHWQAPLWRRTWLRRDSAGAGA